MANSTNKTWLSSNDLQDETSSAQQQILGSNSNSNSSNALPSSTPSSLDRHHSGTPRGRKLDDSEVLVYSPSASNNQIPMPDIYEDSKSRWHEVLYTY